MSYSRERQSINQQRICMLGGGGGGSWDDGAASDQGNGDSSGDVGNDQ